MSITPLTSSPLTASRTGILPVPAGKITAGASPAPVEKDPFLRKTLDHFRWPLLPAGAEDASFTSALAPALEVLRPPRSERHALLPQNRAKNDERLREALTSYESGTAGELAGTVKALLAHQSDLIAQFDVWRQSASPC